MQKKRYREKMKESQSNIEKKKTQLRKNEEWNAREKREREHGFYVTAIETAFHAKVYSSLVLHAIKLVYLNNILF